MTDFVFKSQINNVVVNEEYRDCGIKKRVFRKILIGGEKATYILGPDPENIDFYEKLGFENSNSVIFKRKKEQ